MAQDDSSPPWTQLRTARQDRSAWGMLMQSCQECACSAGCWADSVPPTGNLRVLQKRTRMSSGTSAHQGNGRSSYWGRRAEMSCIWSSNSTWCSHSCYGSRHSCWCSDRCCKQTLPRPGVADTCIITDGDWRVMRGLITSPEPSLYLLNPTSWQLPVQKQGCNGITNLFVVSSGCCSWLFPASWPRLSLCKLITEFGVSFELCVNCQLQNKFSSATVSTSLAPRMSSRNVAAKPPWKSLWKSRSQLRSSTSQSTTWVISSSSGVSI